MSTAESAIQVLLGTNVKVNAYCHQDYSMLGRVRVHLNDAGLNISNPGRFIGGIKIHNLLNAEPDALKRIGLYP